MKQNLIAVLIFVALPAAVLCQPSSVRDLPDYYVPDKALEVNLSIDPGEDSLAWVAEDIPPQGWTVSDISESGVYDTVNKKVKWGLYMDNIPRDFSYKLTPPKEEKAKVTLTGIVSVNGSSYNTIGDDTLENGPELLLRYLLDRPQGRAIDANEDTIVDISDLIHMIK